jgi:hypothetical protein
MASSDSLYTYLTSVNNYATGNYIDFGWIVAYSFIAIAALVVLTSRASFERGAEAPEERPVIWPSLVAYAPLVPLAAVHVVAFTIEESRSPLVEGGTLAVFALVLARLILTLYENVHLNRELVRRAEQLSQKLELMPQRNPDLRHLRETAEPEDIARAAEVHVSGDPHHISGPARLDSSP